MESQVELRKAPKQQRAQQTVDRIIQTATDLIIENGMENLSTNKIASASNINISSIYQYFPNKEAIITAIVENNTQKMIEVMDDALEELTDLPIKEVTIRWLNAAIDFYRSSEGLYPEMLKNYSSPSSFPGIELIERRLIEAARKFTMRRLDRIAVEDINVAIYVGFNSAMLVLAKHLIDPNSYLKDEEVIAGIAEMLSSYFEKTT